MDFLLLFLLTVAFFGASAYVGICVSLAPPPGEPDK